MSNYTPAQKLAKESSISFSGMSFGQFMRYVYTALLARWVGAEYLGIYSIANAVTRISETIGKMGLDTGVLRFVSKHSNEVETQRQYILSATKFGLIISVVFMGFQIAVSSWLVTNIFQGSSLLRVVLITNAITLPFGVLTLIAGSATQGYKLLKYKIFVTEMLNPFILLLVMVVSFLFISKDIAIILPVIVSSVIGFIVIIAFLKRLVNVGFSQIISASYSKDLMVFSIPLMFVAMIGTIMHWTDIMMLGYFEDTTQVGLYHPAARTAGLLRTILLSILSIFSPMMSQYHSLNKFNEMNNILQLATRWIITLALPIVLLFLIFPGKVMLLFGTEYVSSSTVLMVLVIAAFVQSIFGTAGSTLTMTGYTKVNLINALLASTLNIILNFVLIPKYGIIGAAIATLISLSFIGIIRYIENWWLNDLQLFNAKIVKSVCSGIITISIILFIKPYIMQFHTIVTLAIAGFMTFGTYFLVLWFLKFDQDDRDVLNALKILSKSISMRK